MAAGWDTGDNQKRFRRNREWITRFLAGFPLYDVDEASLEKVTCGPVVAAITASHAILYAVNPQTVLGVLHSITLVNNSAGILDAWVYLNASTGVAPQELIVRVSTLFPQERMTLRGPWFFTAGATIQGASSGAAGTDIAVRLEVTEMLAATPGIARVAHQGVILTTTPTDLYTVPPTGVHDTYVASLGLVNNDGTDRGVIVELLPNGQGTSPQNYAHNDVMPSLNTSLLGGYIMNPGDKIRGWTTAGTNVYLRINALELAVG